MRRWRGDRHSCSTLLCSFALLGLLALPIDYRGGSDQPHSHTLLQLLIDGGDGHLLHAHAMSAEMEASLDVKSWFDPVVGATVAERGVPDRATDVDPGQQHGPASTYSSMPFLLAALIFVAVPIGRLRETVTDSRRLTGRAPLVLLPPPRLAVSV